MHLYSWKHPDGFSWKMLKILLHINCQTWDVARATIFRIFLPQMISSPCFISRNLRHFRHFMKNLPHLKEDCSSDEVSFWIQWMFFSLTMVTFSSVFLSNRVRRFIISTGPKKNTQNPSVTSLRDGGSDVRVALAT